MCWIGSFPKGVDLTEQEFKNAARYNNDGSGFAYARDGKLFVEKGFMTFDEFYDAYKKIGTDVPRIVHHRMGSGGGKNAENCHPFVVNEDICFAHNGTLSGFNSTATQSDTNLFNDAIVKPLLAGNSNSM